MAYTVGELLKDLETADHSREVKIIIADMDDDRYETKLSGVRLRAGYGPVLLVDERYVEVIEGEDDESSEDEE